FSSQGPGSAEVGLLTPSKGRRLPLPPSTGRTSMTRYLLAVVAIAALFVGTSAINRADDKKEIKAKCPVSGKDAKETSSVEYKGAKVYFCCDNCPKKFEQDTKKFAAKANHQLVATGQAKQVKCPLQGKELNADTKITVAGVDVCFCCQMCQGK